MKFLLGGTTKNTTETIFKDEEQYLLLPDTPGLKNKHILIYYDMEKNQFNFFIIL